MKVADVKMVNNKIEVEASMQDAVLACLEAIGEDAADTAAQFAPVDTGRLKNSITSAVVPSEMAAYIGTNVEYAIYQELGTSRGIAGKHFIQFGATAHTSEYENILKTILLFGEL